MIPKYAIAALFSLTLFSCKKSEPESTQVREEIPGTPVVVVPPTTDLPPPAPAPAPPLAPEDEIGMEEPSVPEAEVVIGEEPSTTPGQKVDRAIQKTGQGLQRLGDTIERKAAESAR